MKRLVLNWINRRQIGGFERHLRQWKLCVVGMSAENKMMDELWLNYIIYVYENSQRNSLFHTNNIYQQKTSATNKIIYFCCWVMGCVDEYHTDNTEWVLPGYRILCIDLAGRVNLLWKGSICMVDEDMWCCLESSHSGRARSRDSL